MTTRRRNPMDAAGLLGPLEYAVMQALWAASPATVAAVLERINDHRADTDQPAYTTVMTVLDRLYDKQLLRRVKVGRRYHYRPRFHERGLVEHLGRQEVSALVDRYGEVALAQFAAALESADPAILRRLTTFTQGSDDA